jgi:hypothetical protein
MLASISSILLPLALTAGIGSTTPAVHHDVRAYVTGYNTFPGQTDSTPCIGASGADICGRADTVACPRSIGLGTTVQIRGAAYVCEDRLAKKFDDRFDISCDKDSACPPQVTGWTTVRVFGTDAPAQPAVTTIAATAPAKAPVRLSRLATHLRIFRTATVRVAALTKPSTGVAVRLAGALKGATVLRGRG